VSSKARPREAARACVIGRRSAPRVPVTPVVLRPVRGAPACRKMRIKSPHLRISLRALRLRYDRRHTEPVMLKHRDPSLISVHWQNGRAKKPIRWPPMACQHWSRDLGLPAARTKPNRSSRLRAGQSAVRQFGALAGIDPDCERPARRFADHCRDGLIYFVGRRRAEIISRRKLFGPPLPQ